MRSEAEEKAAADLRDTVKLRKLSAFDYARALTRMSHEELRHAGYRGTPEQAAGEHIRKTSDEIEKLIRTHERMWP